MPDESIDMPRNIRLKLGGAVATTNPEVVVESASACFLHTFTGAVSVLTVFTLKKPYPAATHLGLGRVQPRGVFSQRVMHTYPPTNYSEHVYQTL